VLNVGIIGLGVGERHISSYNNDPRCNVVALCDVDEKKLYEVGCRYPDCRLITDADELLRDPRIQVISIASYDSDHYQQIIQALENHKHVFVEKPLCLFEIELEGIAQCLRRHPNLKLSSNLILRKTPRFLDLKKKIVGGDLGKLYYLEGDYDYGRLSKITDGWRGRIPYYSVVHGGSIHLIDLILWLTGGMVVSVFARGNNISTSNTQYLRDDFVTAILEFDDGTLAKVTSNFGSVVPHHHKLAVYGTLGTFEQSHIGAAYFFSRDPVDKPSMVDSDYPGAGKGDMLPSFVDHILDDGLPDVTAQEVLDGMAVSLAIEKSVTSHTPELVRYFEL